MHDRCRAQRQRLRGAISGCEVVFHLAALYSYDAPASEHERVNVEGTRVVVEVCRELGVRRLVLTHGGVEPDAALIGRRVRVLDLEGLVAGGIVDLAGIRRLREAGAAGIVLGEALLTGRIEYPAALEAAA